MATPQQPQQATTQTAAPGKTPAADPALAAATSAKQAATNRAADLVVAGMIGRLTQPVTTPAGVLPAGTLVHTIGPGSAADKVTVMVEPAPVVVDKITQPFQNDPTKDFEIATSLFKVEPDVMAAQQGQLHYSQVHGDLWDPAVGPVPEDARHQGLAGDCYIISAMAAVCTQNPQQIEELFAERPKAGEPVHKSYKVSLWIRGADGNLARKTVSVDRWLPETNTNNTLGLPGNDLAYDGMKQGTGAPPAPAAPKTRDHDSKPHIFFWAELIEKAFAMLYQSDPSTALPGPTYDNTGNGGWPARSLEALTGVPSHAVSTPDVDPNGQLGGVLAPPDGVDAGTYVLQQFKTLEAAHRAVVVSTRPIAEDANGVTLNEFGLYGSHAYQFIRTDGNNIILKNPWGVDDPMPIPASSFLLYLFQIADSPGNLPTPVTAKPTAGA